MHRRCLCRAYSTCTSFPQTWMISTRARTPSLALVRGCSRMGIAPQRPASTHPAHSLCTGAGSPLSSPLRLSLDANGQPLSHAHRASQHTAMDTTLLPYPATAVHSSVDSSTTPSSPALGCLPLHQAQSQPAQQSFPQPHGGSEDGNPVPKSGCLPDLLGALASNISCPDSPARRLGAAPQPDGSGRGRRRSVGPRAETKASVGAALAGQRCNAGCSLTVSAAVGWTRPGLIPSFGRPRWLTCHCRRC